MESRQRIGDLEEELELLRKQLQTTQTKVVQQVIQKKRKIQSVQLLIILYF